VWVRSYSSVTDVGTLVIGCITKCKSLGFTSVSVVLETFWAKRRVDQTLFPIQNHIVIRFHQLSCRMS